MTIVFPIKTITVSFEHLGYVGWNAVMRINPPAYVYDNFIAVDEAREWEGVKEIVKSWNFVHEKDNSPFPLPDKWETYEKRKELPYDVWNHMIRTYYAKFNEAAAVPKESSELSEGTSSTNGRMQVAAEA